MNPAEQTDADGRVPVLEVRNVSKAFGHVVALDGVSLQAHPATILAIVGDNGAGKSTMIKALADGTEGRLSAVVTAAGPFLHVQCRARWHR